MPEKPTPDSVFGELAYDPSMKQWSATVALAPGYEVEVEIWWDETEGPFASVRQIATQAFKRFQAQEREHRESLAAAMLEGYQESARPKVRLLPAPELTNLLRVQRISISADGSMMIDYGDAQVLVADHDIVVEINADGTFDGFYLLGINSPWD